jgi:hypothetical protein
MSHCRSATVTDEIWFKEAAEVTIESKVVRSIYLVYAAVSPAVGQEPNSSRHCNISDAGGCRDVSRR